MMKRIINILVIVYVLITIPVTVLLINYNDYNVTELGNKTLIIPKGDLEKLYSKNSLLVINNNKVSEVKVGDNVFYYDTYLSPVEIKCEKLSDIVLDTNSYVIGSDSRYMVKKDIIGSQKIVKVYPILGAIISLLTSKWGYLLLIILPILVLFSLEVYLLIKEVKRAGIYEKK